MEELPKIRRTLRIIVFLVLVLYVLLIAFFIHKTVEPQSNSFPSIQVILGKDGKDGQTPQIDYSKIDAYIQKQIAAIPTPINGLNGANGKTGATGSQGQIGKTGLQGSSGSQGEPGVAGKSIELRYNDAKSEIEWRYVGDLTWVPLLKDCQILNTCEAL